MPWHVMSVRQDVKQPPAVTREQLSPAVRAPVQWTGTGQGTHISKHTCVASAAAATKLRLSSTDVNCITKVLRLHSG